MYKMKRIIFEGVEEIEKRQRIDSIAIDVVLYGKNLKFKGYKIPVRVLEPLEEINEVGVENV